MNWNEQDYEQVARFLDGQAVELTTSQRELAKQFAADSRAVAARLDVAMPAGTLHRVNARMARQTSPRPLWRKLLVPASIASAAAALVLLAVMLRPGAVATKGAITPSEYVSAYVMGDSDLQEQAQSLSEDIAMYQDEWANTGSMDPLEQEMGESPDLTAPSQTE